MRTLLVSICCLSLACLAGAAQQQDQDQGNQHGKKKGGQNVQSQQVVPATPKVGGKVKYHAQGNVSGAGANANVQQNAPKGKVHLITEQGTDNRNLHDHHGKVTGQTQTNVSGQTNASGNANLNTKLGKNKFSSQTNVAGGGGGKFQKQHFNLSNKVSGKYQAVKFNQNYKIAGANKWQGAKYQVFVNYQPQWHDQYWWTSHHSHIVFFFGAPYYWDNNYCYPAWGYYPGANYYYDGPIYASNPDVDLGQEVANVQAALQEQGYYHGEIDGVLGPQTRAALADLQVAQGLEPTGTIDEPTLEYLGMA